LAGAEDVSVAHEWVVSSAESRGKQSGVISRR
jgi:hypothetical protein